MNYNVLNSEMQNTKYFAMTDAQAAIDLNTINIAAKQEISAHNIRKYLTLVNKLISLEASTLPAAVEATRLLEIFPTLDMAEAQVEAKLISILDSLVTATLISTTDKNVILAFGDKLISRAAELGLGVVRPGDVAEARKI